MRAKDRVCYVGIRRPRRRSEPGGRVRTRPRLYHPRDRHPSPPPGTRVVGGWWSDPPPPALCSGLDGRRRPELGKMPRPQQRTAMRLLIVEDDRDAADYIARAFRE